jgi:hypothetical protein
MGDIIDLNGNPLRSSAEIAADKEINDTVKTAIGKVLVKPPPLFEGQLRKLNEDNFGYFVIVVNKEKSASRVYTNLTGDKAELVIHETVTRHYQNTNETK